MTPTHLIKMVDKNVRNRLTSIRDTHTGGSCGKKVDDVSGRLSLLPQSSHSVGYASTFIGEEEKATSSSPIGDQILMAGVKVSHVRIVVM
ncbi:hypothetical protein Bca101_060752 [Brassica carinata]